MPDTTTELLEAYRATPTTLRALLRGAGAEEARRRPDPENWSIIEIVAHLGDAERLANERIRRMLDEERPAMEAFDQLEAAERGRYRERDLEEVLLAFAEQRAAGVSTLEAFDAAGWARVARHVELGDITIEALVRLMVFHDAVHLAQIGRIVSGE